MARFPYDPSQIHIGITHDGTYYELELRYVCLTDCAAVVVEPEQYAGGWVLSHHIPYMALPTLRGYTYDGQLTWWMMDEIRWQIENGRIRMDFDQKKLKPWYA